MIQSMNHQPKVAASDEEDDLESLRLAALQSLKRKNAFPDSSTVPFSPDKVNHFRAMKGRSKRGRFFGPHQGRGGKSAHFNRARNTNLISITPVSEETNTADKTPTESCTTLTLPQDRYCKTSSDKQSENAEEGTSKFNRYNNSDKSESESETEDNISEEEEKEENLGGKLERADSLEALMQELDNEIQGKPTTKEENEDKPVVVKTKKPKKKKSVDNSKKSDAKPEAAEKQPEISEESVNVASESKDSAPEAPKSPLRAAPEMRSGPPEIRSSPPEIRSSPPEIRASPPEIRSSPPKTRSSPPEIRSSPPRRRPRSRSPFHRRHFPIRHFTNPPPHPLHLVYAPPPSQFMPPMPFPNPQFNPMFAPPQQRPLFYERPLSPLAINTDSLTTATMAPLSPRSAAFVLQNKAIIEKRKRSPRRSYSRSRSRSLSRSPRRSLTPPRRLLPRRPSPRRRSLSPKRRSPSPRRAKALDVSPRNKTKPRERLGGGKEPEIAPKKEDKPLDPVLEARKRKFESNQLGKKAGIIRLKPKEEKTPQPSLPDDDKPAKAAAKDPDEFKELEQLLSEDAGLLEAEDLVLDHKVADIFSDEDSLSENEGRFKASEKQSEKVSVLPFTKLVNGVRTEEIKSEALPDSRRTARDRGRAYNERRPVQPERRRAAPTRSDKSVVKQRTVSKVEGRAPAMEKRFERKIEIRIKNPAKYERSGKSRSEVDKNEVKVEKKVVVESEDEVTVEVEDEEEEVKEKEVVKADVGVGMSGDEENAVVSEGDLRAQLSRKRAEKMHKLPTERVSSRLLQYALEGAVFKKPKKKSKEKKSISTSDIAAVREILHADYFSRKFCFAMNNSAERKVRVYKPYYKHRKLKFRYYRRADGKLPIHLRLGVSGHADVVEEVKPKKKSRKRKNREVLEQV